MEKTPESAEKGYQMAYFAWLREANLSEVDRMGLDGVALAQLIHDWLRIRPPRRLAFTYRGVPVVIGYDEEEEVKGE